MVGELDAEYVLGLVGAQPVVVELLVQVGGRLGAVCGALLAETLAIGTRKRSARARQTRHRRTSLTG